MDEYLDKILSAKNDDEKSKAVQEFLKNKYRQKFPTFTQLKDFTFPNKVSCEQATSENIAKFKSSIFQGANLLDMTGGLGTDTFYFSSSFDECIYIEKNKELFEIYKSNVKTLDKKNISAMNTDSVDFLKNTNKHFDYIYIDPHRRKEGTKKISFEEHEPNVLNIIDILLKKAENILIKTSPLVEIDYLKKNITIDFDLYIIEEKGNVREVLIHISSAKANNIYSVNIDNSITNLITNGRNVEYGSPQKILLEPSVSMMKIKPWEYLCEEYNIKKIAENTHYFTSDKIIEEFPGKQYLIEEELKLDKKLFKRKGITKANIKSRNHPLNSNQIKSRLGLNDGGNIFIFAFTDLKNKKRVFRCSLIKI